MNEWDTPAMAKLRPRGRETDLRDATNFLADAVDYLRGRNDRQYDPDAALDAIEEARNAILEHSL